MPPISVRHFRVGNGYHAGRSCGIPRLSLVRVWASYLAPLAAPRRVDGKSNTTRCKILTFKFAMLERVPHGNLIKWVACYLLQAVVMGREEYRALRGGLHSSKAGILSRSDHHPEMGPARFHGPSGQGFGRAVAQDGPGRLAKQRPSYHRQKSRAGTQQESSRKKIIWPWLLTNLTLTACAWKRLENVANVTFLGDNYVVDASEIFRPAKLVSRADGALERKTDIAGGTVAF